MTAFNERQADDRRSIQTLLGDALRETQRLAAGEFALFKAELDQNLRTIVIGIVLVIAAAVFAIATVILLTNALVEWLAVVLQSEALASLVVAAGAALIALGLGYFGYSKLSSASLTPERTVRSVRRDAAIVTERTR